MQSLGFQQKRSHGSQSLCSPMAFPTNWDLAGWDCQIHLLCPAAYLCVPASLCNPSPEFCSHVLDYCSEAVACTATITVFTTFLCGFLNAFKYFDLKENDKSFTFVN